MNNSTTSTPVLNPPHDSEFARPGLRPSGNGIKSTAPGPLESTHPLERAAREGRLPRRVLIAEDCEVTRQSLVQLLKGDHDIIVDAVADGRQALQALLDRTYSIAITDLRMPGMDGMQLLEEAQKRRLDVTFIMTTGFGSIDDAVRAMRMGAYDFLSKPVDVEHLRLVLKRALRERTLHDEVASLREQLQNRYSFQNILSKNPRMHAIFETISHLGQTSTTVLIEGETGTGKEQIARAIHSTSTHRTGPMVAVNCAALPESLLESELFGHEKGAFTGAVSQRRGRFETANGGTLFLDEVGDVPPAMQAKLLRVLQERCFERVGGVESIEVDVRVIGATNRSLQQLVKEGKFREDLYYRLNVIKLELPPLRERTEDIPLLVAHFMQKYAGSEGSAKSIAPEAMELLLRHRWSGNVRELENVIERACVTTRAEVIGSENLPIELVRPDEIKSQTPIDLSRTLAEQLPEIVADFEKRYIRRALRKSRGHVGRSARICGISRRSMTAKIARYSIDKSLYRQE